MSEEILVNVTPPETRVAIIENGVVQEVIVERTKKRGIVGNIYKGKVCRVLPGMQAAFVDAGLERAAFLHASDIANTRGIENPNISDLVQTGSPIIVQVVKDPLGITGHRDVGPLDHYPGTKFIHVSGVDHVGPGCWNPDVAVYGDHRVPIETFAIGVVGDALAV